jgi:FkbM family methyltransferase
MEDCLRGLAARGFKPKVVADVGAAEGSWTRHAMQFWPKASYFLFEPLEERKAELTELAKAHSGIRFFPVAVGRSKARLSLGVTSDLYGSSLAYSGESSRMVAVEALDAMVSDGRISAAQFLKIDVQGFEFEVLGGAEQFLTGVEVAIIETYFFRFAPMMSLLHEMIAYMTERGFRPYELFDQLRRPYDGAVGQCDVCFVRVNSPLLGVDRW